MAGFANYSISISSELIRSKAASGPGANRYNEEQKQTQIDNSLLQLQDSETDNQGSRHDQ